MRVEKSLLQKNDEYIKDKARLKVISMTNKNENVDLKIFTMRNVPEDLRKQWKVICTLESCSMEQFAVDAIKEKVESYFRKKNDELEATRSQHQQTSVQQPQPQPINVGIGETASENVVDSVDIGKAS